MPTQLCLVDRNDRLQSPGRGHAAGDADCIPKCHGAGHACTAASRRIPRRIRRGRAASCASTVRRAASCGCQRAGGRERRLGEAPRRELHGQQAGLHGVLPGGHCTTSYWQLGLHVASAAVRAVIMLRSASRTAALFLICTPCGHLWWYCMRPSLVALQCTQLVKVECM